MLKLIFFLVIVGVVAGLLGFAGISHLAFSGAQFFALILIALVVLGVVALVTVGRRIFGS